MDFRCEIAHLVVSAKEDRFVPEIEVLIGDGPGGTYMDMEYRQAGVGYNIATAAKQVDTLGIGSYIKVIFKRPPPKTSKNPCGQVGLTSLRVWG